MNDYSYIVLICGSSFKIGCCFRSGSMRVSFVYFFGFYCVYFCGLCGLGGGGRSRLWRGY